MYQYIFWIINNHSFIQINLKCVLSLIKNEKKNILIYFNTKGNTNWSVTIDDHWCHYLICYSLNFNLHRINMRLHALIKYTSLIRFFWIGFGRVKHYPNIVERYVIDPKTFLRYRTRVLQFNSILLVTSNTLWIA
jgi:hypothetical protein